MTNNGDTPIEIADEDVQEVKPFLFGFTVLKGVDGNYAIQPVEADEVEGKATFDDIYGACAVIQRNIAAQEQASAIQAAMVNAAQQVEKSKSGIVIPNGPIKGS